MTGVVAKTFVLAICLALAYGCKHGLHRQEIDIRLGALAINGTLAKFFGSECQPLGEAARHVFLSLQSVVDYVLRDTKWYIKVRNDKCSGDLDVPECWIDALNYLLDRDSLFFTPTAECICQWAGTCVDPLSVTRKRRSTGPEVLSSLTLTISESEFTNCISNSIQQFRDQYPSLQRFEGTSIALFLREHYTSCRSIPNVPYDQKSLFQLLYLAKVCPKSALWRDGIVEVFRVATREDGPLGNVIDDCDPETQTDPPTTNPIERQQSRNEIVETLRNQDSILFTQFDLDSTASINYAPADPDLQIVNPTDMLNSTLLIYTKEGFVAEYRGLVASYEDEKVWANNFRRSVITVFDVNRVELTSVARDLTNSLQNLAYDHVTEILYWTDSGKKIIMAMDTSSYRHFAKIWKSDEVSPYGLALHTTKRKLFFGVYKTTGTSISKSELIKCDLDGLNKETILRFPDVIRPRSITIDFSDDKLYWTDITLSLNSVVLASDLNGKKRRQFFAAPNGFLWDIAHYENFFYITDVLNSSVNEYNIYIREKNGRRGRTVKTNLKPRNIDIYAPNKASTEIVPNECEGVNCEHFCVAKHRGDFSCKCSPGYKLDSGYKCVTNPLVDEYLIVADIGQKRVFQVPLKTTASLVDKIIAMPWDNQTVEKIYAVGVDRKNGDIAWYNLENNRVMWEDRSINFPDPVVSIGFHCCRNQIFWASSYELLSWDGISSRYESFYLLSFFSDSKIRHITLDCVSDRIYWTEYDTVTKKTMAKRSGLTGKDVEIVLRNLPSTKGITIDYEEYILYVMTTVDGMLYGLPLNLLEKIPSTNPNYSKYKATDLSVAFDTDVVFIWDIRVKDGMVYLTDSFSSSIFRFDLSKGPSSMEDYGPGDFFHLTTLDFYDKQHYNIHMKKLCVDNKRTSKPETTTKPPFSGDAATAAKASAATPYIRINPDNEDCNALLQQINNKNNNEKLADYLSCVLAQPQS